MNLLERLRIEARHDEAADEIERLRAALLEAREALVTLDHMNGQDSGLAVIRGGKPIEYIIDAALGSLEQNASEQKT